MLWTMNYEQLVANFAHLNDETKNKVLTRLVQSAMIVERTVIGDLRTNLSKTGGTVNDQMAAAADHSWSALRALGALREV